MEGEASVIKLIVSKAEQLQTEIPNIPAVLKTLPEKRGMTCKLKVRIR